MTTTLILAFLFVCHLACVISAFTTPCHARIMGCGVLKSKQDGSKCQEETIPTIALSRDMSNRRSILSKAVMATGALLTANTAPQTAQATITNESNWPLWTALPVAPFNRRRTIRYEIAPGVYAFDQLLGIYYVHLPIRMSVVAVHPNDPAKRGLVVYAPVAPTKECLRLLQELIDKYGPVRDIIDPSTAVEHKVNAGPFARAFPKANFYVVDKQYSFPLNLPNSFLGLPSWTKPLPRSSRDNDMWGGELEHEVSLL